LNRNPTTERSARIREFLENKFPDIRAEIVTQWEVSDGSFWCGEVDTHNESVYEALKMADWWHTLLIARIRADERGAVLNGQAQPGQDANRSDKPQSSVQHPNGDSSAGNGGR